MKATKTLVMVAMFVIISSFAMAAWTATLNTPASSGAVRGTYTLNCSSTTTAGTIVNVTNATFKFYCSDSANSTYYNLTTKTSGANATSLNATWASTAAEDSANCYFMCILGNASGAMVSSTASTGVIIDNTVPSVPSSITPTSVSGRTGTDFSATVSGANTTGCSLIFTSGNYLETLTMTHSGNTCTYTDLDLPSFGYYQYKIMATDGLNTSTSSIVDLQVNSTGGGNVVIAQNQQYEIQQQQQQSASQNASQKKVILVGAIALGIFGYYSGWFGKKKKR